MKMMINRHWQEGPDAMHGHLQFTTEIVMKRLWYRLSRWFHSFDEPNEEIPIIIRTAEDGARVGMVGWY
jgi:hypothetical protein